MASLDYWLPRVAIDAANIARAWMRYPRERKFLAPNVELRDRFAGQEVYIIGNGPSLNNFDLARLYGRRVITMNHFELHPDREKFDIVAHCVGEPYGTPTWEDPHPMLYGVPAKIFFFNVTAADALHQKTPFNIYYYGSGLPWSVPSYRRIDLTRPSINYQSTSQMAIALAIFMGFKSIKLIGFDHDWLVTRGHSPHFYEEREGIDKADLSAFAYLEMIEISRTLFRIYVKLKALAEADGCRIYNLSEPTYLDVFARSEAAT